MTFCRSLAYDETMEQFTKTQLKDLRVLTDFVRTYCNARHATTERHSCELPSQLARHYRADLKLCPECAGLLAHGISKRRTCPLEPKPACKECRIHCYGKEYRAKIREVMAFSGRRLLLRGRLDYLWHYFF